MVMGNLSNLQPNQPIVIPEVGQTYTNPHGHKRIVLEIVGDSIIFTHHDPNPSRKPKTGSCRICNWSRWLGGYKYNANPRST